MQGPRRIAEKVGVALSNVRGYYERPIGLYGRWACLASRATRYQIKAVHQGSDRGEENGMFSRTLVR